MIPIPVIAIFDIGKTNKKFFLIDEAYTIVFERSSQFEEIVDEDGDLCDDIHLLSQWVIETLTDAMHLKEFEVRAVNISAYGASFVYIDEQGKVLTPLYSYLKKYPAPLQNELYEKYGGAEKISCETASPLLGSLNSGMQLYRMKKEKPALYNKVKYALHLPQYIHFLITKQACSDITSIGCHTLLWDFQKMEYHQWVKAEGLDNKLAPLLSSDKTGDFFFDNKKLKVGTGLHDSSAALIPYQSVFNEPFILLSTGTWCISLNPFNETPLTAEDLNNDCLCYIEYHGKPVKASRLFAGYEHERQVKKLAEHFNKPVDFFKNIKYDPAVIAELKKIFSMELLSEKKENKLFRSDFDNRKLADFNCYEQAYHCLMIEIIRQQIISTQLVIRTSDVNCIFVDGGFSNNSVYMNLLALAFPGLEVYAASVAQTSAMGAALSIHKAWNNSPIPAEMIKLICFKQASI